ncbi:hypothetical protein D3C73_1320520 [compost metagenome]
MVVFLYDEDEAVQAVQLVIPSSGLLACVCFPEQRQFEISDVDNFIVCVAPSVRMFLHPFAYLRAYATFARASQDNSNIQLRHHFFLLDWLRCST